ncbi:unnamed protein product [Mycena citricolor]|uniref:Uncharacterized protein n=1 Tax=Mycena citricolor TaxID=2018698 RepID=A0AAD2JXG7_9AGAR|nr:unnamed protein product [Mycena citricolor]
MRAPSLARTASLLITLGSGLTHTYLTLRLASLWLDYRPFDGDAEPAGKVDGLRVLWALLGLYTFAGATLSYIGLHGVIKNKAPQVRLYRDCATADLVFTSFLTALACLAAWSPTRTACETPQLAPLLSLILPTLSLIDESCERALAQATVMLAAGMLVLTVARTHCLLAVRMYYTALLRSSEGKHAEFEGPRQIRLLPLPSGMDAGEVVYAPVHLPADAAPQTETWIRATEAAVFAADAGLLDVEDVDSKRDWI